MSPIPVSRKMSDSLGEDPFPCFFCEEDTMYCTELDDRTGSDQVNCCPSCAAIHDKAEIPPPRQGMIFLK